MLDMATTGLALPGPFCHLAFRMTSTAKAAKPVRPVGQLSWRPGTQFRRHVK